MSLCRRIGVAEGLDIIGCDVVSSAERRQCLAALGQSDRCAWTRSKYDLVGGACLSCNRRGVTEDVVVRGDALDLGPRFPDRLIIRECLHACGFQVMRIEPAVRTTNYFQFVPLVRIVNYHFHEKSVELSLGKWICTFIFNRILCGRYEEDAFKRMILAIDRHLSLLHRLKEC